MGSTRLRKDYKFIYYGKIKVNNEVENILKKYNLKLLEYNNNQNIYVIDTNGYKYRIVLYNYRRSLNLPHLFRGNPFAIDNIKNYLKIHDSSLELLSTNYIKCNEKLAFICRYHRDRGIQYKTLDCVVNSGNGCSYCHHEKLGEKCRQDTSLLMERCNELGLEYIDRFIKNKETWVHYTCEKHLDKGIQEIAWYHLKTCTIGCPYCAGKYKNTSDFIAEMKEINKNIKIIGKYRGSEEKIQCKCTICGHLWNPIGRSLKNGQGCPHCSSSKGEEKISNYLDKKNIKYIAQKTFNDCTYKNKLKFDFYIPDLNLCIEYDGEQHFFPVDFASKGKEWAEQLFKKNQEKDKIKNDYCKQNRINLVRIPYLEYENIGSILDSKINL